MTQVRRIRASAPGRAGIVGNPTDGYGGAMLACTIGHRSFCEITPGEGLIQLKLAEEEVALAGPEELALGPQRGLPERTPADVARAAFRYFLARGYQWPAQGFTLTADTDIPMQAGLAGSTAITTAILGALAAWFGASPGLHESAEAVRIIEHQIMGQTCGYQDQYMACFGGVNFIDFAGKEWQRQDETEPFATVEPLEGKVDLSKFAVVHTGVRHDSTSVHKPIRERWETGEAEVVESYREITRLARLGKKALLLGDWAGLGKLMNENHALQRGLGGSGEINEHYINLALAEGAWGAKLAGAGQGGTIILLHETPEALATRLVEEAGGELVPLEPQPGLVVEWL